MEIRPVRTERDYRRSLKEIGRLNRVYEVLNGKRALTLPMIRHLHRDLGIPAECLIRPPKSARAA